MGYMRPVPFTGMSSWYVHRHRGVPSVEPGTDYYCPVGTPLLAAGAGVIVDTYDGIQPATGRFVTIDLDDGRRIRYLHLSRRLVSRGDRVYRGQLVAYSGASGYGEEDWSWNVAGTGGAHVHTTLWRNQRYAFGSGPDVTLDPELYMDETPSGASGAGNGGVEFDMPLNKDDVDFLNGMGQSIKDDIVQRVLDAVAPKVWGHAVQAQNESGILLADKNGKPIVFPASGFLASTNARAGSAKIALSDAQAAAISGQVAASTAAMIREGFANNKTALLEAIDELPAEIRLELAASLANPGK